MVSMGLVGVFLIPIVMLFLIAIVTRYRKAVLTLLGVTILLCIVLNIATFEVPKYYVGVIGDDIYESGRVNFWPTNGEQLHLYHVNQNHARVEMIVNAADGEPMFCRLTMMYNIDMDELTHIDYKWGPNYKKIFIESHFRALLNQEIPKHDSRYWVMTDGFGKLMERSRLFINGSGFNVRTVGGLAVPTNEELDQDYDMEIVRNYGYLLQ